MKISKTERMNFSSCFERIQDLTLNIGIAQRFLAYSWKRIAGVGYEHTRLANSAVSHGHTLDESRCGHDDNDPFADESDDFCVQTRCIISFLRLISSFLFSGAVFPNDWFSASKVHW